VLVVELSLSLSSFIAALAIARDNDLRVARATHERRLELPLEDRDALVRGILPARRG
jgi:hypothetical protein